MLFGYQIKWRKAKTPASLSAPANKSQCHDIDEIITLLGRGGKTACRSLERQKRKKLEIYSSSGVGREVNIRG